MSEQLTNAELTRELSPLTDSLTSCIRWRLSDYEAMLRGEMQLLLGVAQSEAGNRGVAAEHRPGL